MCRCWVLCVGCWMLQGYRDEHDQAPVQLATFEYDKDSTATQTYERNMALDDEVRARFTCTACWRWYGSHRCHGACVCVPVCVCRRSSRWCSCASRATGATRTTPACTDSVSTAHPSTRPWRPSKEHVWHRSRSGVDHACRRRSAWRTVSASCGARVLHGGDPCAPWHFLRPLRKQEHPVFT